jgi:hypothetical protein
MSAVRQCLTVLKSKLARRTRFCTPGHPMPLDLTLHRLLI